MKAVYIGQDEFYDKVRGYCPVFFEYGNTYDIEVREMRPYEKYRYKVYITDECGWVKTWIPYKTDWKRYWAVILPE